MRLIKSVYKFISQRELLFTLIAYPSIFFFMKWLYGFTNPILSQKPMHYGYLSLILLGAVILYVVAEIFMKFYSYGLQGDKLKMREQQGISIEDLNNNR